MSRTIKFRAWDSKGKYMLDSGYGDWVSFDGVPYTEADSSDSPHIEIERAKDYVLMQWTGLHDKNGKEIYEGDICVLVNTKNYEKEHCMSGIRVVEWSDQNMCLQFSGYVPLKWGGHESIEVIGNIHQNPELIKQ